MVAIVLNIIESLTGGTDYPAYWFSINSRKDYSMLDTFLRVWAGSSLPTEGEMELLASPA